MRAPARFVLDTLLAIVFVIAYRPQWTGVPVHQWLSIALVTPLLVHLVINWEWAVRIARTYLEKLFSASRLNFAVDVLLMLATVTVTVSGLMVSPALVAPLGVHVSNGLVWHFVHLWSANATVLLLLLHFLLHASWFASTAATFVTASRSGASSAFGLLAGSVVAPARPQPLYDKHGRRRSHVGWYRKQVVKQRAVVLNTANVLALTLGVGVLVAGGVAFAGPRVALAHSAASAARGAQLQVCPSTGCTAASCHGDSGQSAAAFYGSKRVASFAHSKQAAATARSARGTKLAAGSSRPAASLAYPTVRSLARVAGVPSGTAATVSHGSSASTSIARQTASKPARAAVRAVQVCPVSGCAKATCHGAHGVRPGPWYATHS